MFFVGGVEVGCVEADDRDAEDELEEAECEGCYDEGEGIGRR